MKFQYSDLLVRDLHTNSCNTLRSSTGSLTLLLHLVCIKVSASLATALIPPHVLAQVLLPDHPAVHCPLVACALVRESSKSGRGNCVDINLLIADLLVALPVGRWLGQDRTLTAMAPGDFVHALHNTWLEALPTGWGALRPIACFPFITACVILTFFLISWPGGCITFSLRICTCHCSFLDPFATVCWTLWPLWCFPDWEAVPSFTALYCCWFVAKAVEVSCVNIGAILQLINTSHFPMLDTFFTSGRAGTPKASHPPWLAGVCVTFPDLGLRAIHSLAVTVIHHCHGLVNNSSTGHNCFPFTKMNYFWSSCLPDITPEKSCY